MSSSQWIQFKTATRVEDISSIIGNPLRALIAYILKQLRSTALLEMAQCMGASELRERIWSTIWFIDNWSKLCSYIDRYLIKIWKVVFDEKRDLII